jgi:hypothetical protein
MATVEAEFAKLPQQSGFTAKRVSRWDTGNHWQQCSDMCCTVYEYLHAKLEVHDIFSTTFTLSDAVTFMT